MGGGGYDKNVYNYRGAWKFEQQCAGMWRPGHSSSPGPCPHCHNLTMESGTAILFHGDDPSGTTRVASAPRLFDANPTVWFAQAARSMEVFTG